MKVIVKRSDVAGMVVIPGSKSYTIRAVMCAAMAKGESIIENALESEDTHAVLECVRALGADVSRSSRGLLVHGTDLHESVNPLWCRESGATLRFLAAVAATIPGRSVLRCAPSLARRPMGPLLDAIRQLGVKCSFDVADGELVVEGRRAQSSRVMLRGDISSQFVSAMLLSGPRYAGGLHVHVASSLVSERYLQMTVQCMRRFGAGVRVLEGERAFFVPGGGYTPTDYVVEGDWSAAAAILALGTLSGKVGASGLDTASVQADAAMVSLLQLMGASVTTHSHGVTTEKTSLHACTFDLEESIDLLPVACVLAAVAEGVTRFTRIGRARDKESDRVAAMADGLRLLGIRVEVDADEMRVWGGTAQGGVVSSAGDHRVAMAFGVLGTVVGDITIEDAGCVSKTYPSFWETMEQLGVEVHYFEQ